MFESLLSVDADAFLAINTGLGADWLDPVMTVITWMGDGLPVALYLLLAVWLGGRRSAKARVLFALVGVGAGALVVQGMKHTVARARPGLAFASTAHASELRLVNSPPRGRTSWPSGHSQASFGAAVVLGELWRRGRIALLVAAALVGLSRVYVGAHFPLDVLAGALIGVTGGAFGILLWRRKLRDLVTPEAPRMT